jgi:hypothetical protein
MSRRSLARRERHSQAVGTPEFTRVAAAPAASIASGA